MYSGSVAATGTHSAGATAPGDISGAPVEVALTELGHHLRALHDDAVLRL